MTLLFPSTSVGKLCCTFFVKVAIEKTKFTLNVNLEKGFEISINAALPQNGAFVPIAKGVDANGNTVPGLTGGSLFALLRAALTNGHKIECTFDTVRGFPLFFRIQEALPASSATITVTTIQNYVKAAGPPSFIYTQNKKKWEKQQINDYDYTFEDLGPNPNSVAYPVSVKVRNSVVTEAKDINGASVLPTISVSTIDEVRYLKPCNSIPVIVHSSY